MAQVHKRFGDNEVKALLEKYMKKEVERKYIEEILGIKKRRFFELLKSYKDNPDSFTVKYKRKRPTRKIDKETDLSPKNWSKLKVSISNYPPFIGHIE